MRFLVKQCKQTNPSEVLAVESNVISFGPKSMYAYLTPGLDFNITINYIKPEKIKVSGRGGVIIVAGKQFKSQTLRAGDEFSVGFYTIGISPGQSDDDVCLEITRHPITPACDGSSMTFAQAGLSMRFWSYSLFVLMLIGTFLLPFLDTLDAAPYSGVTVPGIVPTESSWSAGTLHNAHVTAGIDNNCRACHTQAFEVIPDSACLGCHDQINEHVAITPGNSAHFLDSSCSACHIEHMEPSYLVNSSSKLCVNCHGESQDWAPDMPVASKFSALHHPEFKVSVWEYDSQAAHSEQWQLNKRVNGSDAKTLERSNIKFPHDTHMDATKMSADNNGQGLACVSCHAIGAVDGRVTPISMERNCQACHELTYDIDDPSLVLPHGSERQVIAEMESHFYRRARQSGTFDARERVQKEAAHQFSDSGCVTCHLVEERQDNPLESRWHILPVRISQDWYPAASFNHAAHMNSPGISSDSNSCLACHQADKSHDSKDILMPTKDTCLGCHSSERGSSAEACISCHVFHAQDGTLSLDARTSLIKNSRSAVDASQ